MSTQTAILALLTDFDDPDLSELDLAKRHGLTLDQLHAAVNSPVFQHALARLRDIREIRQPLLRARAEARAAEVLTNLTARDPTTATAAKEIRLALKDLLRLLGAGGFQPPDRAQPDALASPAHAGEVARRSRDGGGLGTADGSGHSQEPPPPPLSSGTSPGSPGEANRNTSAAYGSRRSRFKPRPKPISR